MLDEFLLTISSKEWNTIIFHAALIIFYKKGKIISKGDDICDIYEEFSPGFNNYRCNQLGADWFFQIWFGLKYFRWDICNYQQDRICYRWNSWTLFYFILFPEPHYYSIVNFKLKLRAILAVFTTPNVRFFNQHYGRFKIDTSVTLSF